MTVSVASNLVKTFSGDGATVAFSYTHRFDDNSELVVIIRDSDGNDTVKTITTHYTVSGALNDAGGTVTFLTAPAVGETVVIYRATRKRQTIDLENQARADAPSVELQLDQMVRSAQDIGALLDRAVLMRPGSSGQTFPQPSASKIIRWNSTGTALENKTASDLGILATGDFGESLLATAAADDARALLLLDDMVNLKWFGAVGDGVTDDSAAVQAWLDFIVANERLGYVPAGNFLLTTAIEKTLTAAKNFGIVGAGIGVSVFTVPSSNSTGGIIIDAGAYRSSQFVARDFTILADGVSLGTGLAFTMTAGGNQHQRSVVAENVEVKGIDTDEDCFDIGMNFAGTWRPLIRACICGGPFGTGISSDLTDASPIFVATANLVIDDAYDWTVDNCHLWSAHTALRDNGTISEAGRLTNSVLVSCRVGLYRVRTDPEPIIWIENNHVNFRDTGFHISGAKLAVIRGNHPYNQDTGNEYSGTAYDIHLDNAERTIIANNVFHYDGAADRINIFVDTATLGNNTLINGNVFSAQAASAIKVGAGATGTLICNNLYPGTITTRYTDNSAACVILDYKDTTGLLYQTNAGNSAGGPSLDLFRNSASPAAADYIGMVEFNGRDSAANKTLYALLQAQIVDPTNGSEDAAMQIWAMIAGTATKIADFRATAGSGTVGMMLLVDIGGVVSMKQVKLGAADSGGTGLRALVVDNS